MEPSDIATHSIQFCMDALLTSSSSSTNLGGGAARVGGTGTSGGGVGQGSGGKVGRQGWDEFAGGPIFFPHLVGKNLKLWQIDKLWQSHMVELGYGGVVANYLWIWACCNSSCGELLQNHLLQIIIIVLGYCY